MSTTAVDELRLTAPAKINLYLQVTGRRPDGYHLLATLMQKIGLFDQLVLQRGAAGISLSCPDSGLPEDEGNIVYRAARLFLATMAERAAEPLPGVKITLYKSIPVAAGLGGGSSDAAAVLCGLDKLFGTRCPVRELLAMGASLGADVPLFVVDWPVAWATGIGDRLQTAAALADVDILLVNPGFSVSTSWAYERFALTAAENIFNLSNLQKGNAGAGEDHRFTQRPIRPDELRNDLERVTADRYAEIGILKERLLKGGAAAALMSGSGPSVFGLFPKQGGSGQAEACFRDLARDYDNTFLVPPLPAPSI